MLQAPADNTVDAVLVDLQTLVLAKHLVVQLCLEDEIVQRALISQALNVLGCVRVDVLERSGQLIVKTLDERHHAARNLDVLLAFGQDRRHIIVLPLLGILNNNVLAVLVQSAQKLRDFLLSCLPVLQRHGGGGTRAKVESGRYNREQDADALIGRVGDLVELLHDLNLFGPIGVLLATRLHDRAQVLEDALGGELQSLAALAHSREALVVEVVGGGRILDADLLRLRNRLVLGIRIQQVDILVLAVFLDLGLVLLVDLLDLLFDGIETLGVQLVHLLGADFLLGDRFVHEVLEIGDALDVRLGGFASIAQLLSLAVKFVELWNTSASSAGGRTLRQQYRLEAYHLRWCSSR